MEREEELVLLHVLTHPARYKIAESLLHGEQLYISQIAGKFNIDPKVASFHVRIMEKKGLVTTHLEMLRSGHNPVLARYVKLTEIGEELMHKCKL